jgi:hypothetical protein
MRLLEVVLMSPRITLRSDGLMLDLCIGNNNTVGNGFGDLRAKILFHNYFRASVSSWRSLSLPTSTICTDFFVWGSLESRKYQHSWIARLSFPAPTRRRQLLVLS